MAVAHCQRSAAASLPLLAVHGCPAWHSCPRSAGSAAALRLLALKRSFPASDAFVDKLLGQAALIAVLHHVCEASPGLMGHLLAPVEAGWYRHGHIFRAAQLRHIALGCCEEAASIGQQQLELGEPFIRSESSCEKRCWKNSWPLNHCKSVVDQAFAHPFIIACVSTCNFGSDSHLMIFLPSLLFTNGESAPCEPVFEFRRLCRVGWLSRA